MNTLKIIIIKLLLINLTFGLYCPPECTCVQNSVRCLKINLKAVPRVSPDTAILDLRYNQITELGSQNFNDLNEVHTIFLSDNRIEVVHDDAFYNLKLLKYLYLNNNRINKISSNVFQGLENLRNLYLENNNILEISSQSFKNLPNLITLFLSKNKLKYIPADALNNLPELKRLRLDNNPIECDCNVYSLYKFYKSSQTQANIALVCFTPEKLKGLSLNELKDEDFHCQTPKIVEESMLEEIEINLGDSIQIPCKVDGDPTPEIHWMKNSTEISNQTMDNEKILENGSLEIKKAQTKNIGTYECLAKNSMGVTKSRPVRMIVNAEPQNRQNLRQAVNFRRDERPRFINQPKPLTSAADGQSIVFHCNVIGNPVPQIQWSFNSRQIQQSTQSLRIYPNGTLQIHSASLQNAGLYQCRASNSLGTIAQNFRLEIAELPEVILVPKSQTVKTSTKLILECDGNGDPVPNISWKFNENPINANPKNDENSITERIFLENENTELHIENVNENDAGQYTCIIENVNGKVEAEADILVERSNGPPKIIFGPFDIEVLQHTTIEIPCKSDALIAPQVKWRKDGRSIVENEKKIQVSSTGSLYVKNLTISDTGRYECSISNEYGRDTAFGLVTVRSNDVLAPGDRFVRLAFTEASKEIDLAINNTVETLFNSKKDGEPVNHGDLLRLFRFPNAPARQLARAAEIYERTLVNIRKHIDAGANLTIPGQDYSFKDLVSQEHLHLIAELSGCMEHRETPNCTDMCFHSKYRSIDGTCNNLQNPTWGASLTAFRRVAKPVYENGFSMPIGWTKGLLYNGFEKPSARLLSTKLIATEDITPDTKITHMVMQWGQFLDHDLDHAIPSVSSESWDGIDCKKTCEMAAPCYPIEVPDNDPRVKNRRCIDLVRSSAICGSGMTSVFFEAIQPREQINQLTAYIDASQVYGYSYAFAQELRNVTAEDGLLRTGIHFPNQKDMLPFAAPQDGIDCRRNLEEANVNCFVAGDIRVNEQVGLLAMHTIWLREHNRIATKLKELNPHWDGDTLYEESRKIVGAQMQHFTFKHWLPIILGDAGMEMLGEYKGYNPSINPSISNVFATAALRFGHTLINPILHRLNTSYDPIPQGHLQLHKAFFSPWRLVYEGGVDPLMRGLFSVPAKLKTPAQNLNTELTEKLFHTAHAVSLDLAAINIQRGRDHGLPSYNEYRKFCNLTVAKNFEDLQNEITNTDIRNKLKELYGHVSNIDVFVGGILEDQVDGGKVGPLFRCLLVDQFRKLRDGDRFYYENPTVFLPQQLNEIKQSNLGRVLCDNGDNITEVQENVFILPSAQGGYMNCNKISGINLYFWQDCSTCNSLPPILASYVPHSYEHLRQKRSVNDGFRSNDIDINDEIIEVTDHRISGLEEVISIFQKELKKLRKKVKTLEKFSYKNIYQDSEEAQSV